MSGGVDSAVALLRAGPKAIGVTLRLWIDPQAPDTERACCSPEAVIAARETCHALGIPHVTLDLREDFRRAIVEPFVDGYARGETPNPCIRCNGELPLRAAARLRRARRRRRGSRRATTPGSSSTAAGCCSRARRPEQGPVVHARPARSRGSSSASGSRSATRRRTRRGPRRSGPGSRPRGRAESQEACFLAGDDYRAFLERHGLPARDGPIVDEAGARSAATRVLALHAGPAQGPRRRDGGAALRARSRPGDEHRRRRAARGARPHARSTPSGRLYAPVDAGRGEASLPLAGRPAPRSSRPPRLPASISTSPRTASRRAGRRALRGRRRRRRRARSASSAPLTRNRHAPRSPLFTERRSVAVTRRDHADAAARPRVLRRRPPRARRARRAARPHDRESRGPRSSRSTPCSSDASAGEDVTLTRRRRRTASSRPRRPVRDGVRAELEADRRRRTSACGGSSTTVVDDFELVPSDDGDWVQLTKAVETRRPA